jgi:hypothetical protein
MAYYLSWLERRANNAKIAGSSPACATVSDYFLNFLLGYFFGSNGVWMFCSYFRAHEKFHKFARFPFQRRERNFVAASSEHLFSMSSGFQILSGFVYFKGLLNESKEANFLYRLAVEPAENVTA